MNLQAELLEMIALRCLTCSMFSSISSSRASFVILPMKAPFEISTPGGGGAPPPPCCNAIEKRKEGREILIIQLIVINDVFGAQGLAALT